jgi:predicted metal-binding protein
MDNKSLMLIVEKALELGAAAALLIDPADIVVNPEFVEMCRPPQCNAFGIGGNCPPHVMSPEEFKGLLAGYDHAVVFKVEAPMAMLLEEEHRFEVIKVLQETTARLERFATEQGFANARGFAGGSCRRAFCRDEDYCEVIEGSGSCRNPDRARPSLSGVGVNFQLLNRKLDWEDPSVWLDGEPLGVMTGVVFLG